MKISEIILDKELGSGYPVMVRIKKTCQARPYDYDCKAWGSGSKRGWTMIDGLTINALKAIYNNLKPENQAKFDMISLPKLVDFAYKHCKIGA